MSARFAAGSWLMRAELKSLDLDPDPASLPSAAAEFSLVATMFVGPADGPGEESFDITVCTPEWLAESCRKAGGFYNPRHHVVVNLEDFDRQALWAWLAARVKDVEADTWAELAQLLSRLGYWEFEDYQS
jgi:Immunity protein 8